MKYPRAKDALISLKNQKLIEPLLHKAWDRLRNASAHGAVVDSTKIQEHLNDCQSVLVLFYQLIF